MPVEDAAGVGGGAGVSAAGAELSGWVAASVVMGWVSTADCVVALGLKKCHRRKAKNRAPMAAAIHRLLRCCGANSTGLTMRCLTSLASVGMVMGVGLWGGFGGVGAMGSAIALDGDAFCGLAFVSKVGREGGMVGAVAGSAGSCWRVGAGGRMDVGLRAAAICGRPQ